MATKTKWLGAVQQSDERDTVAAGEKATINSSIKAIEDAGSTYIGLVAFKGGILLVYSTP